MLKFDQPVTVVCDAVIMQNISISENCEMRLMVSSICHLICRCVSL